MDEGGVTMRPIDDERLAAAILREVNALRRNPQEFSAELSQLHDCFEDKTLTYPESGTTVQTIEGVAALEDCLEDLRNVPSLTPLTSSQAVSRACAEHLADLQDGTICSHVGQDGSTPEDRIGRHGSFREQCGENIVFGALTAKEVVYQMLLDDGAPERGHRANLLNMDFHFVGIAVGAHASTHMVVVLMFLDNFQASKPDDLAGKRYVVAKTAGQVLVPSPDLPEEEATVRAWDRSMQYLKPDYMKVPEALLESVERQHRGRSARLARNAQTYFVGHLIASPGINPAIVKAFVHRVDRTKDDIVQESEIASVCYHHQLKLSPSEITELFNVSHVKRLNKGDYEELGMDWAAIFKSMRPVKRWSPAVDIFVECVDGRQHVLVMEVATLLACCAKLLQEAMLDVPAPQDVVEANKALALLLAQAEHFKRRASGTAATTEALASQELSSIADQKSYQVKLRQLLAPPGQAGYDWDFRMARCSNPRNLYAHEMSPHRETWLRLFHAVGLNPLVFPPEPEAERDLWGSGPSAKGGLVGPSGSHGDGGGQQSKRRVGQQMRIREPKPNLYSRQGGAATELSVSRASYASDNDGGGSHSDKMAAGTAAGRQHGTLTSERMQGEDDRLHSEMLVNDKLQVMAKDTKSEAQMSYGFDARRAFMGVLDHHQRTSDESRLLARERKAMNGTGGTLGSTGASMMTNPGAQLPQGSTLGKGALRAHFHNSCVVYSDQQERRWPAALHSDALKIQLNGEHIDQTKVPAQKEDVKLSRMTKAERDKQFSCLFGKETGSSRALKSRVALDQAGCTGEYDPNWCNFDPRPDAPQRYGKFGRRVFDPQVRSRGVSNPCGISQIEARPQEEARKLEERVQDILERQLPPGQLRPFKTHMPKAEAPTKQQELASRKRIESAMQGERKSNERGFGQFRHSDRATDMYLYTRPLNVSHMDRQLPMA
mmetsp:Transcript_36021/g.82720  ORF Transcript_36021/g.82720 Transcript_36021/m.82720 type:complete len:945 (-) Transcript_36021:101-2935(-)